MSTSTSDSALEVLTAARRARAAATDLAVASRAMKDAALLAIAAALLTRSDEVLAANATDVATAGAAGATESYLDRLRLDQARVDAIAADVVKTAGLPDPVGEVVRGGVLANGLELRQLRVPLGVVGIIYEGRPNVTVDAAALCLKSGNAVL
ncbi:MAG: glutamate-5-semialdehyde dehydrogenase, partial [Actinomycetota bacterium]|nr:glutamate-5-semialdehyde dehydrogenase [Actinomycetota bacterium]